MIRHVTKLCRLVYPWESAADPIYQGKEFILYQGNANAARVVVVTCARSRARNANVRLNVLFHSASPLVAAFLATDQPSVVGSYLKTCFAQRQSVLASPLLAWLLNFVELD